ncbi:MAG: MOSC domain-containing protein [Methylococcales bacterium]|nr:MOSC domain-containing protein [Methylococcales bacterium]
MTPFLSEIIIYPIKSLAGIRVNRWQVTKKGLRYDRKWMLIDQHQQFLSQRRLPKMALIKTQMIGDVFILSAPKMETIRLSLIASESGEQVMTHIWKDDCVAYCVSDELDQWFSDFLGQKCRLVYQPHSVTRLVDANYATPLDKVNFSDGFPFLILSEASLGALNSAMALNLSMDRFRPNLVIAGCEPYAEDFWRKITVGNLHFRLPKPCSRCSVPAIHPKNATITKEPLTTLSRLRKVGHKVYFGQNALHDDTGFLAVNEAVSILERGVMQPPLDD